MDIREPENTQIFQRHTNISGLRTSFSDNIKSSKSIFYNYMVRLPQSLNKVSQATIYYCTHCHQNLVSCIDMIGTQTKKTPPVASVKKKVQIIKLTKTILTAAHMITIFVLQWHWIKFVIWVLLNTLWGAWSDVTGHFLYWPTVI